MARWQDLHTGLTAAASHGSLQGVPEDVRDTLAGLGWVGGSEADSSGVYPTQMGWRWLTVMRRGIYIDRDTPDQVYRGSSHT